MKSDLTIKIITSSEELPPLEGNNFFHSVDFFRIVENTPGQDPFMVVVQRGDSVRSYMLATLRHRGSLIPPYLFTQGRVYGDGWYTDLSEKEELFPLMLDAITKRLRWKMCLYIEFSNLSSKMFGYKTFRQQGYFPVHWMEIHNSLHSKSPQERLTPKRAEYIEKAKKMNVTFKMAENEQELKSFYKMLKSFFSWKIRRYLPPETQFVQLHESGHGLMFLTKHKDKLIGGCTCIYSNSNAYLWYIASKRKTYASYHPTTMTVWGAINYAYEQEFRHIYFMDVGLPLEKTPYRDFILSFGGKEVSSYRWFRFSIPWLNKLMGWFYRE